MNEEIMCIAARAAMHVWERWGFLLPPDLRADVEQEALVGAYKASKRSCHRGYIYKAALREALNFVFRRWLGRNPSRQPSLDAVNTESLVFSQPESPPARPSLSSDEAARAEEELFRHLWSARKIHTPATERAARREARILALKMQGYTKTEIAERLSIPRAAVAAYTARARARLKKT